MATKQVAGAALLSLLLSGCQTQKQPALGEPLAGLTPEEGAQFVEGKKVFERVFEPKDGLGPLFNGNSCAECHEDPVVGGVGDEVEVHATRFSGPNSCDPLFQEGGPVIQQNATPLLRAKGIEKEQIPASATAQARRTTPPLFGFGLVDAIPKPPSWRMRIRTIRTGTGSMGASIARLMDGSGGSAARPPWPL